MGRQPKPIDISSVPELARLAREVAEDGQPRVLRAGGTDLAILSPARRKRHGDRRAAARPPRLPKDSVVAATAGALKAYAKQPSATIEEETAAFEQGVAEEHVQHVAQQEPHPPRRHGGRPTSAADPLWTLVGMVTTYDGPTDVSEHVDRYLAEAHAQPPA